jgi:hypothetical protein
LTKGKKYKVEVLKWMMFNDMDDLPPEYGELISKLSTQIEELFSKLHYYQGLIAEKEIKINQLTKENDILKLQIRDLSQITKPPPKLQNRDSSPMTKPPAFPSQEPYISPAPKRPVVSLPIQSEDSRINKRVCPECGAVGFAIREVDDKSKILIYSPRRVYAKKKICTKCRFEFSN